MVQTRYVLIALVFFLFLSCNHDVKPNDGDEKKSEDLNYEILTLTSEDELNMLITRGDNNIVDWQLSKEFAELWLSYGIESKEYPLGSELLDLPIAIYSSDGNIKFYEFRIVNNGKTVGSIVGAATKDYGCPIVYEGFSSSYTQDIKKLYAKGKITQEDLPRLVDDGYPSVVIGKVSETKGANGNLSFESFVDLKTGVSRTTDSITRVLTYEEAMQEYAESFNELTEMDKAKINARIEKYKEDGKVFWEMAEQQKGKVGAFMVRGEARNNEVLLPYERMSRYWDCFYGLDWRNARNRTIENYSACGAVAEGFVLDYLASNGFASKCQFTKN